VLTGYIAYHKSIPIYVGIGKLGRYLHVLKGSHNAGLRFYVNSHPNEIEFTHFQFETRKLAEYWEIDKIAEYGRRVTKTGTLFNITPGGDGGNGLANKGRIYYHHPETFHTIALKPKDEVPEGYILGNGNLVGRKWFHSLDKKERIYCNPGTEPDGWIQGHTRPGDDRKRYIDPITGDRKRFYDFEAPEGWLEEHWSEGRKWYFKEGKYKMFHSPPEGWELKSPNKGREGHCANKGRRWITNGIQSRRIKPTETVPENWVFGKAKLTKDFTGGAGKAKLTKNFTGGAGM
jgi:hypothetical protein